MNDKPRMFYPVWNDIVSNGWEGKKPYPSKIPSHAQTRKQEEQGARTFKELLAIEKKRGYKKGWAFNKMKSRLAKSGIAWP